MRQIGLVLTLLSLTTIALAQSTPLRLAQPDDPAVQALVKYMMPRFTLKHRVKVVVVGAEETADLALRPGTDAPYMQTEAGEVWELVPTGEGDDLDKLVNWLNSEVGHNTLASFKIDGTAPFRPAAQQKAVEQEVIFEGDTVLGEELALLHCGRCHVVSEKNKYGGIGSTPSFGALRTIPGWEGKFAAFFALNPHPSFTQVDGVTEPFHESRPPHIAPIHLTLDEVEAIAAFAATIKPKDLGAPVQSR
ncbi:hypothetical protein [Halovulum sp. GXIMD14793]